MTENKTKFSMNIIAIAGLVTAFGGLITILHQTGIITIYSGYKIKQPIETPIEHKSEIIENQFQEPVSKSIYSTNNDMVNHNKIKPHNSYIEKVSNNSKRDELPINNYSKINYTGSWISAMDDARYEIIQNNLGQINLKEYQLIDGIWIITAEGDGNILNNKIRISINTIYGISLILTSLNYNNTNKITFEVFEPISANSSSLFLIRQ